MKIQCDVCNKQEASVFCSADEAALCDGCDNRVHHANKLASKHLRFSLLHPSYKDAPRCDVCQESRAFLFCKEDRAILCRECDVPIHTANEHTQKHNRFLLTGVKLSSSILAPNLTTTATSSSNDCDASVDSEIIINNNQSKRNTELVPNPQQQQQSFMKNTNGGDGSTSSISEYLIDMLPGWHVEDFLDSSSAPRPNNGYCKTDDLIPFLDSDVENNMAGFPCDDLTTWVPQVPASGHEFHRVENQKNGDGHGLYKELKEVVYTNAKNSKRWYDHSFTVPQISLPSSNKRSRLLW